MLHSLTTSSCCTSVTASNDAECFSRRSITRMWFFLQAMCKGVKPFWNEKQNTKKNTREQQCYYWWTEIISMERMSWQNYWPGPWSWVWPLCPAALWPCGGGRSARLRAAAWGGPVWCRRSRHCTAAAAWCSPCGHLAPPCGSETSRSAREPGSRPKNIWHLITAFTSKPRFVFSRERILRDCNWKSSASLKCPQKQKTRPKKTNGQICLVAISFYRLKTGLVRLSSTLRRVCSESETPRADFCLVFPQRLCPFKVQSNIWPDLWFFYL